MQKRIESEQHQEILKPLKKIKTLDTAATRLVDKFTSKKQENGINTKKRSLDQAISNPSVDPETGKPLSNPFDEIAQDRDLQRRVILHMALQRNLGDESRGSTEDSPSSAQSSASPRTLIDDGFYWREFPVCEAILYKHMAEYYGISSIQRQSKMQQSFNKNLVFEVQQAALSAGLTFAPTFTEKKLRDRIRCFYKTHLQNAKKRLMTLAKRSDCASNQAIVRVFVRCVKTGVSFSESLESEPDLPSHYKRTRLTVTSGKHTAPLDQDDDSDGDPAAEDPNAPMIQELIVPSRESSNSTIVGNSQDSILTDRGTGVV